MQGRIVAIAIAILLGCSPCAPDMKAQESDSLYHVTFDLGLGPAMYLTKMHYENLYGSYPFVFTFKLMWEPEHLLRLGIESGYLPLFYLETEFHDTMFGSTKSDLSLNSVPIMAVFAMEVVENFEIVGGVGGFLLISEVTSFDNYVLSTSWSNAYEFGLLYLHPLSKNLKIGGEIKSYYISRLENYDLVLQISFKYSLFSY